MSKPDKQQSQVSPAEEQQDALSSSSTRRGFVRKMVRTAVYVAPVVATLAHTKQAAAASPSGVS